jgi:hypothetical protein
MRDPEGEHLIGLAGWRLALEVDRRADTDQVQGHRAQMAAQLDGQHRPA